MPFVFDYETVLAAETQFLPSKGNFLSLCPKTTKISKAAYSHNTDSMKGVDLSKVRRALNLPQRLNKTDYNKDSQVPQIRKVGTNVQNRKDNLCDTDTGSPKAVWMWLRWDGTLQVLLQRPHSVMCSDAQGTQPADVSVRRCGGFPPLNYFTIYISLRSFVPDMKIKVRNYSVVITWDLRSTDSSPILFDIMRQKLDSSNIWSVICQHEYGSERRPGMKEPPKLGYR